MFSRHRQPLESNKATKTEPHRAPSFSTDPTPLSSAHDGLNPRQTSILKMQNRYGNAAVVRMLQCKAKEGDVASTTSASPSSSSESNDHFSRTYIGVLESVGLPKLTSRPTQIAREPKGKGNTAIHPDAQAFLQEKLEQFYRLLSETERIKLKGNGTIALGMATVDGQPRLVYTTNNNIASPQIRAAADKLDLHQWKYDSGVKGRGAVGAPNDAEQLMIGFAEDNHADLHAIVVSRRVCADCKIVIGGAQIPVTVVEDSVTVPPRGGPAPTTPTAKTASGEIDTRGGKGGGGAGTKQETPATKSGTPMTSGESEHPGGGTSGGKGRPGGGPSMGGKLSKVGAIGVGIAASALEALSVYLIAKGVADFENEVFNRQWTALQPKIQTAMAGLDVEKSLKETNYRKTIYANIHMDVEYVTSFLHTRSGSIPRWAFTGLSFVGIDVSAQDIKRNDKDYFSGPFGAQVWHLPFTYSVPIAEPTAVILPDIRVIHNLLAAIRTDLMAVRGGTAGEAVALDSLNVALQATDYMGSSAYQHKTADERFHLTVDAITHILSVLRGSENQAIQRLTGRVWGVKTIVEGLSSRWPIMVEEHGG